MQAFLAQVALLGQQLVHCQLAEFFHFHVVRQPSRDGGLKTSSAQVVCRQRGAETHARPIPARHPAQTKCCRAALWRPKTPAGPYPYPFVFLVGAPLPVYPGKRGSTIFLCASCCE